MKYPCNYCNRVEQPWCCDCKGCPVWRRWFMSRWERTRRIWWRYEEQVQ